MSLDLKQIDSLLREVAAAEILPRFRALGAGDVKEKSGGEVVTVADEAAERALTRRLPDFLPGSLVVGEEAVAAEPDLLRHVSDERPVWLIDPIDGTANFSRGIANFVVMVALLQKGETRAAWIHAPTRSTSVMAEAGAGAYEGDRRLAVADVRGLPANKIMATLHAGQFSTPEMARHLEKRRHLIQHTKSKSSAGLEYWSLARGDLHCSFFTKLMPWDHAPGVLIHREAGGVARFSDTGALYSPLRHAGQGLLMTPDEASWQLLHRTLFL